MKELTSVYVAQVSYVVALCGLIILNYEIELCSGMAATALITYHRIKTINNFYIKSVPANRMQYNGGVVIVYLSILLYMYRLNGVTTFTDGVISVGISWAILIIVLIIIPVTYIQIRRRVGHVDDDFTAAYMENAEKLLDKED